jgi:hypothetical protein
LENPPNRLPDNPKIFSPPLYLRPAGEGKLLFPSGMFEITHLQGKGGSVVGEPSNPTLAKGERGIFLKRSMKPMLSKTRLNMKRNGTK